MDKSLKNFIMLVIVVLLVLSCKNTSKPDTTPDYLFKATFTNNWVEADKKCIIFISDLDGNVLAENTFSGDASFELNISEELTKSLDDIEAINVTTVKEYYNYISILTYINIPVGSSWTWKGTPSANNESVGIVDFNFQNIPNNAGYVLSSKWSSHYSFSTTLPSQFSLNLYETPMNIYLKLNTIDNGVKYVWLNNVVPGDQEADLSNMNNTKSKVIQIDGTYGYKKYLYGFPNPNHRYEGVYRLDYGYDDTDQSVSSIEVYYPENKFSDYRTSLYSYDETGSYINYYYQSIYGDIPDEFIKINADFNFINTTYDNFEISANGDFIETGSLWNDTNDNQWYVYSDKTTLEYELPKLPNSVTQLFGLKRESFVLRTVRLINYPELSSYDEIMDILFKSDDYFYDVVNIYRLRQKKCINSRNADVKETNKWQNKEIEEEIWLNQ